MRRASGASETRKSAAIFSEPCILSDCDGTSEASVLSRRAAISGLSTAFSAMSANSQTSVSISEARRSFRNIASSSADRTAAEVPR